MKLDTGCPCTQLTTFYVWVREHNIINVRKQRHDVHGPTIHMQKNNRTYLVTFDNIHNFASDLVPEKDLASIRPRHDELAVWTKKVGLLYLLYEVELSSIHRKSISKPTCPSKAQCIFNRKHDTHHSPSIPVTRVRLDHVLLCCAETAALPVFFAIVA